MNLLLAVAVLALAVSTGYMIFAARVILSSRIDRSGMSSEGLGISNPVVADAGRLSELSDRIDTLTLAVDEGIRRVDRAENRIQKTVTSARRLVRDAGLEHAGIEAEYEELQPRDAEPSEGLPAVPAAVAETRILRIPGGQLEIGAA